VRWGDDYILQIGLINFTDAVGQEKGIMQNTGMKRKREKLHYKVNL
jgi:hypothetical protein